MARTLATLLLLAALVAAVFAGRGLLELLRNPEAPQAAISGAERGTALQSTAADKAQQDDVAWQPIFGDVEDQPEPVRATPKAAPPSFDYALKGVIAAGDIRWAILSGAGSDLLVQEGDVIDEVRIAEIRPRGIDVEIQGDRRSINFTESSPVEVAEIELSADDSSRETTDDSELNGRSEAAGGAIQKVAFQDLTREQLQEILKQAEQKRRERGWVMESRD